jgi:hypothetical protein
LSFRLQLFLTILVGLLIGGVSVRYAFPPPRSSQPELTVSDTPSAADTRYGFGLYDLRPDTLVEGWARPENWGTKMKGTKASFRLPVLETASGDIELNIEAQHTFKSRQDGKKHAVIRVRCNGVDVGGWPLSPTSPGSQRFIIPQSVFNRNTPAVIELEESQTDADVILRVRAFTLRSPPLLGAFRGNLDGCEGQRFWGWAVADSSSVPVVASINGQRVEAAFVNVYRPDLEAHALPNNAGFELTLANPVPDGTTVSLSFYGSEGKVLQNSPCRR